MHPLNKLFALNKGRGKFRMEAAEDSATVYLYDVIVDTDADAEWWGGVSAQAFVKAFAAMTAPVVHLRINSPGGSVFAGRAMEQAVREYKGTVIAHVDGYAASAATMPLMAASEVEIAPGGMIMIHKAWTIAMGNSDDLMQTADLLDKIDGTLVKTYAARTGAAESDVSAWMAAETWLTSEEAVERGFADRISEAAPKDRIEWDLSAYVRAPAPAAEDPPPPAHEDPDRAAMLRALDLKTRI